MPLGLLLEEEPNPTPNPTMPNIVRVIELLDGGSASGGGVRVGDALRGMTAVRHTGLELLTRRPQTGLLLTRASLALDP
tara:strand:- start:247 stop:483 length:237 start_codon:yes stop_codon:yes gene_type:complete